MKLINIRSFSFIIIRCFALLISVLICFCSFTGQLEALNQNEPVIEYLRLHVSEENCQAWLKAEEGSWSIWLAKQTGFLGRELFWDKEKNEGLIFIRWSSLHDWKSIPQSEVDMVQDRFEILARQLTNQSIGNPFPIQSQGELIPK